MKAKDFAVGVRVEHTRQYIDFLQHGKFSTATQLGSARYRLSWHDKWTDHGVYSFCMCPGGYVLSSGTEKEGLVVNGMSSCDSAVFSVSEPFDPQALKIANTPVIAAR